MITWEWLGGFFDGEGWVTYSFRTMQLNRKYGPYMETYAGMGQKDKKILEKIKEFLKHSYPKVSIKKTREEENGGVIWSLRIWGLKSTKRFCEQILPYLNHDLRIHQCKKGILVIQLYQELRSKRIPLQKIREYIVKFEEELIDKEIKLRELS